MAAAFEEEDTCFFCLEPQNETSLALRDYDKNCRKHLVHADCANSWIAQTGGGNCPACRQTVSENRGRQIDLISRKEIFNCVFCREEIGTRCSTEFSFCCCNMFERCNCMVCTRCTQGRIMHKSCGRRWLEIGDLRCPHCGDYDRVHPRDKEFFKTQLRNHSSCIDDLLREDIPPDFYDMPIFSKDFDFSSPIMPTTFVWKHFDDFKIIRIFDEKNAIIQYFNKFPLVKRTYFLKGSWCTIPPPNIYELINIYIRAKNWRDDQVFERTELGFFFTGTVYGSDKFYGVSPGRFTTAKLLAYFSTIVL